MKRLSPALTLCALAMALGVASSSKVAMAASKYPVIFAVEGKVRWTDKDGKVASPRAKQVLVEKATIETDAKSELVIEIDAHRKLRVFANSKIELPAISWESGDVSAVLLKKGSFRWQESKRTYNLALGSDVFQFLSPVGDFVFSYEPITATAEVMAIQGSLEFSALNADEVALVNAGQKVNFVGVRENDEVVYDILLKGKKIPRGKLGLVRPLTPAEKQTYSLEKEKKALAAAKLKIEAAEKAKAKPVDTQAICQSPAGRLNQCAWTCQNNPKKEKSACRTEIAEVRCVRTRCNANGEWSESTPSSGCSAEIAVRACDY